MATVNIAGLDKAEVFAALFNRAAPQGFGFLHYTPRPITPEEARLKMGMGDDIARMFPGSDPRRVARLYFDYVDGRVMRVDLSGDTFDSWGYDRDNGNGAAEEVVSALRASGNVATNEALSAHAEAAQLALVNARGLQRVPDSRDEGDGFTVFKLTLPQDDPELNAALDSAERSLPR